jgi:hypothetical protein
VSYGTSWSTDEFSEAETEQRAWTDAWAWTTKTPKALFVAAIGCLRKGPTLLPGVTTLTRLVASTGGAGFAADSASR